jgi:hypothetical protein
MGNLPVLQLFSRKKENVLENGARCFMYHQLKISFLKTQKSKLKAHPFLISAKVYVTIKAKITKLYRKCKIDHFHFNPMHAILV